MTPWRQRCCPLAEHLSGSAEIRSAEAAIEGWVVGCANRPGSAPSTWGLERSDLVLSVLGAKAGALPHARPRRSPGSVLNWGWMRRFVLMPLRYSETGQPLRQTRY